MTSRLDEYVNEAIDIVKKMRATSVMSVDNVTKVCTVVFNEWLGGADEKKIVLSAKIILWLFENEGNWYLE